MHIPKVRFPRHGSRLARFFPMARIPLDSADGSAESCVLLSNNETANVDPTKPALEGIPNNSNFTLDVAPLLPSNYSNFDEWNGSTYNTSNKTW